MSISAVNCTPIKPQVSFGKGSEELVPVKRNLPVIDVDPKDIQIIDENGDVVSFSNSEPIAIEDKQLTALNEQEKQCGKLTAICNKFEDKFINSDDIKRPVAIAAAIGGAISVAFAGGKFVGFISAKAFKSLPQILDNGARTVSKALQEKSKKLLTVEPGRLNSVKNHTGKALGNVEKFARTAYKKIASAGLAENASAVQLKTNAFTNVAGLTGVATVLPRILSKDEDGDGVKDILQKSQNVYTGTKQSVSEAINTASKLAELAQIFA